MELSYIKKSFGSCDKHIEAIFPAGEPIGIGILMEITAADGWFYVTFTHAPKFSLRK